jgi:hypothetical protein
VSDEVIKSLLYAESVIIPFERFGESQEASSLITFKDGIYKSWDFIDEDGGPMGPVNIIESEVSSSQIKAAISASQGRLESGTVVSVHLTRSGTIFNGSYENVIEAIDLFTSDGRTLQMRRSGAGYPNSLILNVIQNARGLKSSTAR